MNKKTVGKRLAQKGKQSQSAQCKVTKISAMLRNPLAMEYIGEYQGYSVYWSNPFSDGGRGTGEVLVERETAGNAQTEEDALEVAERYINIEIGKADNQFPVEE